MTDPWRTHGARATAGVRTLRLDINSRPFLVLFELTRACDLACRHCRAEASAARHPLELTTGEVSAVLADLAALGPPRPIVVLTGGDPFKRTDLVELVARGSELGLAMAVSPSGTLLATRDRLESLRRAGARTVSFSLDGADAESHDAFRRVEGSFDWTTKACREAQDAGLRLQVNTTVSAGTVAELPRILRLVRDLGANLWSVFFLVGTGRGKALSPLSDDETEDALHFLYDVSALQPLKTTEAPQYRRVVAERAGSQEFGDRSDRGDLYRRLIGALVDAAELPAGSATSPERPQPRPPLAVGDGRGVVFVSHTGDVSPSGFLPLVVGNVRESPLTTIYRESRLFRELRDADRLRGRCGRCEYRSVCGGSRARAYASSGDPLGEDPSCPYVPAA